MDSVSRHIQDLSRRGLLRGATALAALAATRPAFAQQVAPMPAFTRDPFPLGVASGDPWPDGVVIWTRLSQDPLTDEGMPPAALEIGWEVAEDEGFARIAARGTAIARPELNHSVRVEVAGLRPSARYHYRFHAGGATSPVGRTRTAPPAEGRPGRLRFVSAGCQHYEQGLFTAWRRIAEEPELDFVFHYGDYIYEGAAREVGRRVVRPHNSTATRNLDAYRQRYALYQLDPDLRAAHHAHPFLMSFDDHEVYDNWTGEGVGGAEPPERRALRQAAALQAWYESLPLRPGQMPRGPEITAWRALRWGQLAELDVLDTRSHRDGQPCGGERGPLCDEARRPGAQVLGPAQEEWLRGRLQPGGATWKILAQQVFMMRRELGEDGPAFEMDKWDGYPAARKRLLGHVQEAGVRNLVVLTGDVHCAWAGQLRPDYDDPRSPAVGVEFIATSVSSGRDGSEMQRSAPRILSRNPHLAFHNNRRGYCLHEVDARQMTTDFRTLPYVSRPGAPVESRARFVVQAGRPELLPA